MNQAIKKATATLFLSATVWGYSYAQQAYNVTPVKRSIEINESSVNNTVASKITDKPSAAVQARFNSSYPAAANPVWICTDQFSYVSFVNNGQHGDASFGPGGELNYVILQCEISQLPNTFRSAIERNYKSYQPFNIKQINAYDTTVFQVVIENTREFIILRCTSDGIEELRHVKKGN